MKKENLISIITLLLSLLAFLIGLTITNETIKAILCLFGIVLIIVSIIAERKADNPKVQKFGILHSIIAKSKRKKDRIGR